MLNTKFVNNVQNNWKKNYEGRKFIKNYDEGKRVFVRGKRVFVSNVRNN